MSVYQDVCGPLGNLPKACLSHSQCNSPVTVRFTTATGQLQKKKETKKDRFRGVKHLTKSTDTFYGPKPMAKITSMFAARR